MSCPHQSNSKVRAIFKVLKSSVRLFASKRKCALFFVLSEYEVLSGSLPTTRAICCLPDWSIASASLSMRSLLHLRPRWMVQFSRIGKGQPRVVQYHCAKLGFSVLALPNLFIAVHLIGQAPNAGRDFPHLGIGPCVVSPPPRLRPADICHERLNHDSRPQK